MNFFRSILQYNYNLKNEYSKFSGVVHHANSGILYMINEMQFCGTLYN